MATSPRPGNRRKVQAHRERLREMGLRPVQVWVQDVRSPSFKLRARRQARAVRASTYADDDQRFIDAVSEISS
jgi:citrate lyase gamma subunit